MKTTTLALLVAALAAPVLLAQEPQPRPSPNPAAAPAAKPQREAPAKDTPPVNVRIDVRIIDERAGQPAVTKTVSLTVADRRDGFTRSTARVNMGMGFDHIPLNVDASPRIDGGRVRLGLGIEYVSLDPSPNESPARKLELKERLALVLEDGEPLRVSQSVDPTGDRRVSLEVTATILR